MRRAVRETREALQAAGHQVSTTTLRSSPTVSPALLLTAEITLQKPDIAPKRRWGINNLPEVRDSVTIQLLQPRTQRRHTPS